MISGRSRFLIPLFLSVALLGQWTSAWSQGSQEPGKFAYVANRNSNDVSAYSIDATSGALTPVPGSPFAAGPGPFSVTVDPSGRFVYVVNVNLNGPPGNVSAYTIDATSGALTPVPGSPFPAGLNPFSATVDPSGQFAYVADFTSDDISAYIIDATSGALTPVPGSPFTRETGARQPASVAVDPSGRFVYAANGASNDVSAYTINEDSGALTPVPGSPFTAGLGPGGVTVDPRGRFVYVANCAGFCITGDVGAGNVSAFIINRKSGALTLVPGSPFEAGSGPASVTVDQSGRFLYVRNGGVNVGDLSAFTINRKTGALTPIPGSPFGGGLIGSVAVDPSGHFAYVANPNSNSVSAFTINRKTGAPTSIPGSPFAAGSNPSSVTTTAGP